MLEANFKKPNVWSAKFGLKEDNLEVVKAAKAKIYFGALSCTINYSFANIYTPLVPTSNVLLEILLEIRNPISSAFSPF